MKAAVVFVLLFATVLCRPARKVSDSSSDSSEEVVRRPDAPAIRKQPLAASRAGTAPVQKVAAAAGDSDESAEASDEDKGEAAAPVEVSADPDATPDTASVDSQDSEDEDDKEEEETEEDETEEEEEDSSDSSDSESGESSTVSAVTVTPVVVTEEPVVETTEDPILPTIVTDPDAGRGDSLGGYPSDYKSIIYVEEKSYHKHPGPYKSYELLGVGKKVAYDMVDGNEVEKSPKAYKVQAFQVHSDLLEEDTSTPEVESQGLDASSGLSQDQDISKRQAAPPEEEEGASASESESSSAPEQQEEQQEEQEQEEQQEEQQEEEEESASSSASQEDESGGSSEEGGATATPGVTPGDSDSDESDSAESDSDEEGGAGPEPATPGPEVVAAK